MNKKDIQSLVLFGHGINCQEEVAHALKKTGVASDMVHLNDLISKKVRLEDYHLLVIPGGFSYGDHLGSGKIYGMLLLKHFKEDLIKFHQEGKPILGICNGFQILVKMGLLPFFELGEQTASLSFNKSLCYENRWTHLKVNPKTSNIWLKDIDRLYLPSRHGEGRLIFDTWDIQKKVKEKNLDVLVYTDEEGKETGEYPLNPNGSTDNIAGLGDEKGLVLGLMPHPDAFIYKYNGPSWKTRQDVTAQVKNLLKEGDGAGMAVFYNGVSYVEKNL